MSGYLVNSVTIESNSAPLTIKSGTLLTDSATITAVQNAGGTVANSDATMVAAAAIVAKLRARAGNEDLCDKVMLSAFTKSIALQTLTHQVIDIPLALIKAQTSGVAFDVGAALPVGAQLQHAILTVLQAVAGGTISASKAKVQGGADAAGTIIGGSAGSDIFTAANVAFTEATGSDAYPARGGQQLHATLTSTGDTLANATAGHLQLDVYYSVLDT